MVKGGLKLEINIPLQYILAKSKGGAYNRLGVISSEYGMRRYIGRVTSRKRKNRFGSRCEG